MITWVKNALRFSSDGCSARIAKPSDCIIPARLSASEAQVAAKILRDMAGDAPIRAEAVRENIAVGFA